MEIRVIHLGLIKTKLLSCKREKAAVVIDPGFKRKRTEIFLIGTAIRSALYL